MNELILKDSRSLSLHMGETVYVGDNRITKLTVTLPDTIGGYPRAECQIELRAYIGRDEFLSYSVASAEAQTELRLENDLTDAARNVELTMIITHNGNVIGRTNTVTLAVAKAKDGGEELTPREQFDAVISAQRETIAQQAATIAEQSGQLSDNAQTISGLNTQISELSGEVDELETENTRLENLTETQRDTIQYMINNPPALEYPDNPVIPTRQSQTIRPTSPFYGIGRLEVDGYTPNNQNKTVTPSTIEQTITAGENYDGLGVVTVEPTPLESKTVTPTRSEVTYTPTAPNIGFSSVTVEGVDIPLGGVFILANDNEGRPLEYKAINIYKTDVPWNFVLNKLSATSFIFENCTGITTVVDCLFRGSGNLQSLVLPQSLTAIPIEMCRYCYALKEIIIPQSVTSIGNWAFRQCVSLSKVFIPASIMAMGNAFLDCGSLENVTLETGFNCNSLILSSSTLYSVETIVSWLEALADRTGLTAYTLTIGTTNLNKLTAEQIAIATAKNWNLA